MFGGHRVWDNGISTTPDSTVSALQSLEGPLVLLCGGQAKEGLPLDELATHARARARAVVTFGGSSELLAAAFRAAGATVSAAPTLREAVALAWSELRPGEALLFSPACASFDEFLNFRDRALRFREHVQSACTSPSR